MRRRRQFEFKAYNGIPCPVDGCNRLLANKSGATSHLRTHSHRERQAAAQHLRRQTREQSPIDPGDFDDDNHLNDHEEPYNNQDEHRKENIIYHPKLNGVPCDQGGHPLPPNSPPSPWEPRMQDDFSPFNSMESFLLADLLFRRTQMPREQINDLLQIWARSLPSGCEPPFTSTNNMLETIDSSDLGDIKWQTFSVSYNANADDDNPNASWKHKTYDVWFRDPHEVLKMQLSNREFAKEMDFCAKEVLDRKTGVWRFQDFMSGEWAWEQSDALAEDERNHGATLCPIILGSDKTTVSVATGQNDYYPLYLSNGLIHNNVRRAHRNGVSLIAFLAIPKTDREHEDSISFRQFRRQVFHASLGFILKSLRPGMIEPEVVRYADGHFRQTLYGIGAYIADYPEQVILCCTVQDWCPICMAPSNDLDRDLGKADRRAQKVTEKLMKALTEKQLWFDYGIVSGIMPFTSAFPNSDIHASIAPDILHQLIKGVFKDHLVTWVEAYIKKTYGTRRAKKILADIDRRIAAVPLFANLRSYPEGRGFKQWTGNDSKGLMKVFLPAIFGHLPPEMIKAIAIFTEICYIVRKPVIDENDLERIDDLLIEYLEVREVFRIEGVRPDGFNLPRQHALCHYHDLIRKFGAPNGLCSSITESRHITAVKKPWRRSNRFNALSQMLLTNQRLDKLAACAADFHARGMLQNSIRTGDINAIALQLAMDIDDDDEGAIDDRDIIGEVKLARKPVPNIPRNTYRLAAWLQIPELPSLISRFLYAQAHPELDIPLNDIPIELCPRFPGPVYLYTSAVATYYAPSDLSGVGGMLRERIHSTHQWRIGPGRRDCVFVEHSPSLPGFRGMFVAQVMAFIKFTYKRITFPCAVVKWFSAIGDSPCPDTGMWMVRRDSHEHDLIHIDSIVRAAHLIGIAGQSVIPRELKHSDSLNAFKTFYVNKYVDYHAHEIAF